MRANPRILAPTAGRGSVESSGSDYISAVSATAITSNGAHHLLPTRNWTYTFIALILGTLVVFWAPLHRILDFAANSEFSYIPLLPAISAFLVVIRGRHVFSYSKPSLVTGSIVVVCGVSLLISTNVFPALTSGERLLLPAMGLVVTWCGLFIFCYGMKAARRALLPLGLLLFMVPAPQRATGEAIAFLQHGSAVLAYSLFRMIGVPAIREGMAISLPRLTIEVAPECSGIRSSISLLILTLAGANLYLRSPWNKILLVSLLVPLSILKNAIRIVTLSTLALYVDSKFLSGPLHHRGGILVFFLAFTMLVPVVILMRRWEKKRYRVSTLPDGRGSS